MTFAVVVAFFGLSALGIPIAFGLGLSAIVGLWVGDLPFSILATKVQNSVDSFPFMAIPFFMLAGELMVLSGIMERLITFANTLVGHFRGGLAQVTILSGYGMATVSGTAVADAAALGSALGRPMGRIYGVPFSSAIVAASANLGPIIPPSTPMIIYATLAGPDVSIAKLFAGGIIPGTIIAVSMMICVGYIARRRGWGPTNSGFSVAQIVRELRRALIVLGMPVVVIGGIVGGAFTATEGGAIAVSYAFLVGIFVTRSLRLRDIPGALQRAVVTTAVVGALIAFASTVTYLFTIEEVPRYLGQWMLSVTSDPTTFLLYVFVGLVIVGMFIEPTSAYIMLVPVFAPLVSLYGLDPIHFAVLFVLNLVVGMLTPPVGTLLFVMCSVSGITIAQLWREVWPFVLIQFATILLCLFFPPLITWLPSLIVH